MSDLISRQEVSDIIKTRLYQTALNNTEYITSYDKVCEDIAENRIDTWINEAKSVEPEQNLQPTCNQLATDCISRQAAEERLKKVVDEMALIFSDIREKNVDDSVCGLCEYDCDHGIDGYANECPGFERDDCFKLKEEYRKGWTDMSDIPSVEPERKTGIWTHEDAGVWICGVCGKDVGEMGDEYGVPKYNFCPYCGADMTGRK